METRNFVILYLEWQETTKADTDKWFLFTYIRTLSQLCINYALPSVLFTSKKLAIEYDTAFLRLSIT